jgi:hypothetical protein
MLQHNEIILFYNMLIDHHTTSICAVQRLEHMLKHERKVKFLEKNLHFARTKA